MFLLRKRGKALKNLFQLIKAKSRGYKRQINQLRRRHSIQRYKIWRRMRKARLIWNSNRDKRLTKIRINRMGKVKRKRRMVIKMKSRRESVRNRATVKRMRLWRKMKTFLKKKERSRFSLNHFEKRKAVLLLNLSKIKKTNPKVFLRLLNC